MFDSVHVALVALLSLPMPIYGALGHAYVLRLFKQYPEAKRLLSRRKTKAILSLMMGGLMAIGYLIGALVQSLPLFRQPSTLSMLGVLTGMLVTAGLSAAGAYLGIVVADHMYGSQ